jgi:O-antigen ligase
MGIVSKGGLRPATTIRLSFSMLAGAVLIWSLVGFPFVASMLNALGLPSTDIVIIARMLVLVISLVLIAAGLASRRFPSNAPFLLFLLFFAVYTMRLAHDTVYVPHLLGRASYMYWAFAIGASFVPALALALYARYLDINRLYHPLMLLSAVVMLLALRAGGTEMLGSAGDIVETGRLRLESLNPISLGHVGASVVVLAYWRARMLEKDLSGMLASLALGALGLYVIFATGSRGPLVAMILAIAFFEAVKGGRAAILLAIAAMPLLATLTVDIDQLEAVLGTNLFTRFETAVAGTDASSTGRLAQLASSWEMFLNAPLLGAALEDPTFKIYPHNIIVEAFMATGIFGGTMLIVLLGLTVRRAFQLARSNPEVSIYGALFVQYIVAAQLSGSIYTSASAWVLLGLLVGLKSPITFSSSTRDVFLPEQRSLSRP